MTLDFGTDSRNNFKYEQFCRLCFNLAEHEFEIIDDVAREMFDVLLLKLNLDVSKNPVICKDCANDARKCLYFKSVCSDTEELILSLAADNNKSRFELRHIYEDEDVEKTVKGHFNVCRFCMNQLKTSQFVSLDALSESASFAEMLSKFMPEVNMGIIEDPVICTPCKRNLDSYFKFAVTCSDTEEKIFRYRDNRGSNTLGNITQSKIRHSLFKESLEHPANCIKTDLIDQRDDDFEKNEDDEPCDLKVDIKEKCIIWNQTLEDDSQIIKCIEINVNANKKNKRRRKDPKMIKGIRKREAARERTCTICSYKTTSRNHFDRHLLIHTDPSEIKWFPCPQCPCTFKIKHILDRHIKELHKEASEIYKCAQCTYQTKHKRYLAGHILKHREVSEQKMYKCKVCSYKTKYKLCLKNHAVTHQDLSTVSKYKCPFCPFVTPNIYDRKQHMSTHHGGLEFEIYKCAKCTYETRTKKCIEKHVLRHMDIETYKCGLCTFETKFKSTLRAHMIVHRKSLDYKCTVCSFATKHKKSLKIHMLIH